MILFQNKLLVFLAHGLLLVVDFANLFMTDVLMYEVTTGLTFDYNLMLHNPLFWILLSLHILHIILTAAINIKNSSNDLIVEKAISRQQKKLLSATTSEAKKGNFYNAEELIRIYDELAERRRK